MTRSERHTKKKITFTKAYLIYVAILLIALIVIFLNVRSLMVKYEESDPSTYIINLIKTADEDSALDKYLEEKNFSDNRYGDAKTRKDAFYAAKDSEFTVLQATGNYDSLNPRFEVLKDGQSFMSIGLKEISSKSALGGIMTISDWDIDYALLRNGMSNLELSENGSINCSITMPEGFTLLIDNKKSNLEPASEVKLEEFELVSKTVPVPKGYVYELTDLYYEPSLTVSNNGHELLSLEKGIGNSYYAKPEFAASSEAKDFVLSIVDPLSVGENWSKLMTDDLEGDLHGFYTAVNGCRMLYDTNPYNLALKWVRSVDISFVSAHTLLGFSNEKVDNFVKYNDSLYSCDVYFEKNMLVNGNKTDVFNNRLFFGAAWGTWYLLDMVAL